MPQGLTTTKGSVAVVGGGVIGLSTARQLAKSGWRVTVLERGQPGQEASHAAAGMLAPHLEFHDDERLLSVGKFARDLYPGYVKELGAETGVEVDLRLQGILQPDEGSTQSADGDCDATTAPPDGAELLSGSRLREAEPALNANIQDALLFPHDGSIDNRLLVRALLQACHYHGVTVLPEHAAEEVILTAGRVRGVRVGEQEFSADVVINCCGAWASQLPVPGSELAVRPIKGQMLRLRRDDNVESGPRRPIFGSSYVVPRRGGDVIVGTTVEDRGFDTRVEAGAIARLLEATLRLCPRLSAARFVDAWAGLRPKAACELPTVGPLGPPGHYVAAGHYRNGILFAPLTAQALTDQIEQRQTRETECFLPSRGCLRS